MTGIVAATDAGAERLLELTAEVRRALAERGEFLPPEWVEEAAADLRAGRLQGWVVGTEPGGLAVLSRHAHRAVGHLHVEPGPGAVERAVGLLAALRASEVAQGVRTDVGATGLSDGEEAEVIAHCSREPGFSVLRRFRLTSSTSDAAVEPGSPFGPGVRRVPVRDIPIEMLAQLDWGGFQGTPDEAFVAETVGADQRLLEDILSGRLGGFLDDASAALVNEQGHLLGALLSAEESPRSAVFLDLVVHPAYRRRGLALALLRWGIRAAAALGYSGVELWVTETNRPARALYDRLGFLPGVHTSIYRWSAGGVSEAPQPHPGA